MRCSALRRLPFEKALWRDARSAGAALADTYGFAYRRRYNLPPTDPRYLNSTLSEIVADYWAHRFWDDPKLKAEEVHDPDFEANLAAFTAMAEDRKAGAGAPEDERGGEGGAEGGEGFPPQGSGPIAPTPDDWETVADDRWAPPR